MTMLVASSDAVFFGVVAEGAVRHFQGVGGAGADSAGTFHGGEQEGAFELLDVDFEVEAFGGKDGTVAIAAAVAIAVTVAGMLGDGLLIMIADARGERVGGNARG